MSEALPTLHVQTRGHNKPRPIIICLPSAAAMNELKNQKERKRVSQKNDSLKQLREIILNEIQSEEEVVIKRWTEYQTLAMTIEVINRLKMQCVRRGIDLPK